MYVFRTAFKATGPDLALAPGATSQQFVSVNGLSSGEPERYRKDVPNAQVHVLDAGHFALDTKPGEIAALVRAFVGSSRAEVKAGH